MKNFIINSTLLLSIMLVISCNQESKKDKESAPSSVDQFDPSCQTDENFRNNGPTYTVPGHTAIVTGSYQRISNAGTSLPKNPWEEGYRTPYTIPWDNQPLVTC